MQRIAGLNFLANAFGAGKNGYQDYNPSNGQPGTTPTAAALNALQEEMASFIESRGLALNANDNNQLGQAIQNYVSAQLAPYETAAQVATDLAAALAGLEHPSDVAAAIAAALTAYAPLASPAFTGTPTAPVPGATDSSGKLATTSWVQGLFSGSITSAGYVKIPVGAGQPPLLLQWAFTAAFTNQSLNTVTFPIAFPNAALAMWASLGASLVLTSNAIGVGAAFTSTTQGQVAIGSTSPGTTGAYWLVLGH